MKQLAETMVIPLTEIRRKDMDRCVTLNITEIEESVFDKYSKCELQDIVCFPLKRIIMPTSFAQKKEMECMRSIWKEYLKNHNI